MLISCARALCSVFLLTAVSSNSLFLASFVDFEGTLPVDVEPIPELVSLVACDEPGDGVSAAAQIPEIIIGPTLEAIPAPQTRSATANSAARASKRDCDARRRLRVTAYCDKGTTAAGIPSGVGQCAAPANIPFGSKIYIPALKRSFIVTDRTHERFRTTTVDLFIPDHDRCIDFGRRYLDCEITLPEKKHKYGSPTLYRAIASRNQ